MRRLSCLRRCLPKAVLVAVALAAVVPAVAQVPALGRVLAQGRVRGALGRVRVQARAPLLALGRVPQAALAPQWAGWVAS